MTQYEYNKLYRQTEKGKAQRLKDNALYYGKSTMARNRYNSYTTREVQMILDHSMPDAELSKKIGRSVKAIQVMRSKLKKGVR